METFDKCVILAGGLATRLGPMTSRTPKSLLEINGRKFLDWQLSLLAREGIRKVILCVGHLGEQIRDYAQTGEKWGVAIEYSWEKNQLLGTGGALRRAWENNLLTTPFFVLYGDSYLPIPWSPVWEVFKRNNLPALMTVIRNENRWDQSNAHFEGQRVVSYQKGGDRNLKYIDYGLSVLSPEVIEQRIPPGVKHDLASLFQELSAQALLAGYEVEKRFYEVGSATGIHELETYLRDQCEGGRMQKVKIFFDGADRNSMYRMAQDPMIKGLTTNPTLMKKSGVKDYRGFCREILGMIPDKPISFELFADEESEMRRQALEIHSWGCLVYVKVPVTNSHGVSSGPLIRQLAGEGIKMNVTAVLTLRQVEEVARALEGGPPSIISVFAGRIADTGRDPIPVMRAAKAICESFGSQIELLWASPREALNIIQAEESGCDIITLTQELLKKASLFGKDLDEFSLETVQMFKNDADSAGFQL